jgi:hypothetical protein
VPPNFFYLNKNLWKSLILPSWSKLSSITSNLSHVGWLLERWFTKVKCRNAH